MQKINKIGAFVLFLFLFTACTKSPEEQGDLGEAAHLDSGELDALSNFFDGTADEKAATAADVAATQTQIAAAQTQTNLLVGILAVAALILLVVVIKNKKSN